MDEEKTITIKDVIKVLLGNKWVYLIMVGAFALATFIGLKVSSFSKTDYVTFFDYDVAGFNRVDGGTAYFIDGEKFDPRAMVTKEKILHYIQNNEELKSLDVDQIVNKNAIKKFDYSATYKENDHRMNDYDSAYIADKVGYKLVLDSSVFSYEEAQVLAKAIANEVIEVTKNKIDNLSYTSYLKFYQNTDNFADKVSFLTSGIDYVNELSDSLAESYGDVVIPEGYYGGTEETYFLNSMKLSDWKEKMNIDFQSYRVASLQDELELGGYIDSQSLEYISSLKTTISNLQFEIASNQSILTSLTAQRDELVKSIGNGATIDSLEISAYNTEIIELTKKIDEQNQLVNRYQIQIEKLDKSNFANEDEYNDYLDNLDYFKNKLANIFTCLENYTKSYQAISKKIMNDNMNVYFDISNIVEKQGGIGTLTVLGISACVGVFLPMIINLAIKGFAVAEGKSLIKKKEEK